MQYDLFSISLHFDLPPMVLPTIITPNLIFKVKCNYKTFSIKLVIGSILSNSIYYLMTSSNSAFAIGRNSFPGNRSKTIELNKGIS